MDTETEKVKRLLDLAAAMSSAQAKETGNYKLDMGGIMAVLALAKQEEDIENKNVFLHDSLCNSKKTETSYTETNSNSSSTVSSRVVKTTENNNFTDARTGQKDRNKGFLHQHCQKRTEERTGEEPNIDGKASSDDKIIEQTPKTFDSKVAGRKCFFESKSENRSGTLSSDSSSVSNSPVIGKSFGRQERICATSQPLGKTNKKRAQFEGSAPIDTVTEVKTNKREGHMSFLPQHRQEIQKERTCAKPNIDHKSVSGDKLLDQFDKFSKYDGTKAIFDSISDKKSATSSTSASLMSSSPVTGVKFGKQESSSATGQHLGESTGNSALFTGSAAIAKMLKEKMNVGGTLKNESGPSKSSIRIAHTQDNDKSASPCQIKKVKHMLETQNMELSDTTTSNSTESNDRTVHSAIKTDISKKYTSKGLQRRLTQLLDPNDVEVSKFLAAISSLSSVQEEKTGDGRLDMQGILNAITVARGCDESDDVIDNTDSIEGHKVSKGEKSTFNNVKTANQTNDNSEKLNITSTSNSNTWADALKGAKRSTGLHNAEVASKSNGIQGACAHGSKIGSDIDTNKHSVVSELKNIFKNDTEDKDQNMRKTKVKGYQLPPSIPFDTENIDPKNPTVKRVVYNQYRDMLNSYSVSSQSK